MNLHVISEFRLQTESFGTSSFCAFVSVFTDVQPEIHKKKKEEVELKVFKVNQMK